MKELYLSGDMHQMSIQVFELSKLGIKITQIDMIPRIQPEDVEKALNYFWLNKTDGWWHYEDLYIANNICTKEEFWACLNRQVEARR